METTTKIHNGSPDPSLQTKDGETAGTESEHGKLIVCPPDAALRDCAGCRIMAACKADIRAYQAQKTDKTLAEIPNEKPCQQCLKGTMFLAVEDDGSLWYVCNNKCCMHEIEVKTLTDCARCPDLTKCGAHITGGTVQQCAEIIDAEESNRALQIVAQLKRKTTHDAITSIQRAHGLVGRGL